MIGEVFHDHYRIYDKDKERYTNCQTDFKVLQFEEMNMKVVLLNYIF